jgi:trimethylguanosine synthase
LSSILPIPGGELFELSSRLTPNIAYYLPKNTNLQELSVLATNLESSMTDCGPDGIMRLRDKEWVEVEEEWVGEKVKAITAYYGGLVSE